MTTTVVYSTTADGGVRSSDTVYATARAGTGTLALNPDVWPYTGQLFSTPNYHCYEFFLDFDTSSLPDADAISAATLELQAQNDLSTTDFVTEARVFDWSAGGLTTADWRPGADLGALALVATLTTVGLVANAYTAFVDVAMPANVNKAGVTYLVLHADRLRLATEPTGQERVTWYSADQAGTDKDPKLTVVHESSGHPAARRFGGVPFARQVQPTFGGRVW